MINFLRSAPCKTISLPPTIRAKCICAMACWSKVYSIYVCVMAEWRSWLAVIFRYPSNVFRPWPRDFQFTCCNSCTTAAEANVPGPEKREPADLWGDLVLSAGLLDLDKDSQSAAVKHSPSTFLKVSELNLFNLQLENKVDPKGQKNKSQTSLSFRRKEMHLGIRHACCHGDSPNLCATAAH